MTYDREFFADRDDRTRYAAKRILGLVLEYIPNLESVVDVGCGVGTWLSVCQEYGVDRIKGVDGADIDEDLLSINPQFFSVQDIESGLSRELSFDLAICLEVAEHLRPEIGRSLVEDLVHLSDVILFSAAVPGQGGTHHKNEQWPSYWSALFDGYGYKPLDTIRGRIWHDEKIPVWYRQNILLYVSSNRLNKIRSRVGNTTRPLSIVHPQMYEEVLRGEISISKAAKLCQRSLSRAILRRLKGSLH